MTQGGVEVWVYVVVTVGMPSTELQNGVATCCWRMSVMIVFTALQLMFRSSSGVAKAAAVSAAMIERYMGAILEANEGDAE